MAAGPNQVDHQVRTEEVFLKRQANFQPNVTYYGRTPLFTTLDSETKWQIWRVTYSGGLWEVKYANNGKYNCSWDDRASYFDAPPASQDPPGTTVTGTFTPSGLHNAGRISSVAIDDTSWTPLPATPLAGRNAISIQNRTGVQIALQYDPSTPGYFGVLMPDQFERQYDVTDAIVIYAKASPGNSGNVTVEELS